MTNVLQYVENNTAHCLQLKKIIVETLKDSLDGKSLSIRLTIYLPTLYVGN